MKNKILIFTVLIFITFSIISESLWDDKAKDIYNKKIYYNIGDSIKLIINEGSAIEYKSTMKSLKDYTIDISGGELSGIFSFLPKGNVEENKTSSFKDNLKINSVMQARIIRVENNYVTLTARKQISIDNKTSLIEITGDANYSDIIDNTINTQSLINPIIRITTLIENVNEVLRNADLVKVVLNPDATHDIIEETRINEARKRIILLDFFNKILNVVF